MQRVADQRGDVLNESYRRSGPTVREPFQKTVVNGIECFTGKTRHPNGHPLEIKVYLADSYENAQRFKEQLSSGYQAHGYVTQEDKLDTWMGVFGSTLISVVAEQTSALGVPTTMVVSTPL
jgi:hypothetical protein